MAELITLFGGSFNPIHNGHLIVARSVLETLGASKLVFIPSANPPHKMGSDLAAADDRLEMVRLAIAGETGFDLSDCELKRNGPSYTFDTVTHFRRTLGGNVQLAWLIGADSLPELASWYRISELVETCRIVTAARPGWEQPDLGVLRPRLTDEQIRRLQADILTTPRIDISATDIRRRIRDGRSIRYLVPEAVSAYIQGKSLYQR